MTEEYIPAFNYHFLNPLYDFFVELLGYGKTQRMKVIKLLKLKTEDSLLDVGCGTGTLLTLAKENNPHVIMTGIDIDGDILTIAKRKALELNLKINYVQTSSATLPFDSSTFSVIVSTLVFHHLPPDVKKSTLKEIYRVLKKDGKFLLADFGKKEGITLAILDLITTLLHLPESITLQDNLKGKLPLYLKDVGFHVEEISKRNKGISYFLATK